MLNTFKSKLIALVMAVVLWQPSNAQNVEVDVNENIKHSVGGISDFGRERHITAHASIFEADYEGELNRVDEFINDLDVTLGRDNGTASFLFQFTPADENRPNKHDPDSLTQLLDFWKGEYQRRLEDRGLLQYKNQITTIMGTNPHPTYPTLSYYDNGISGSVWGRENGQTWIPQDIETSAEWMVQFMDEFYVDDVSEDGQVMPEYWEVVNEPDFPLNTGQFMMSSWEDIFEYHNLVATGIKQRLGSRAPKIGGMTWGSHDLFGRDFISRFQDESYVDGFYGNTPADEIAKAYARSQVQSDYLGQNFDWFQWDVMWKGFIDAAGANMDFYSVHFYDWPTYDASGGARRSGGHVEATLEMLESYDIEKFGSRKPIIISEYGAVQNAWDNKPHDTRYDWENLKPFSAMMMQFLERPDYIELSMPFALTKAQFRDIDNNGDGIPEVVYHYKMLRDDDGDGNWEWSDFIKWYRLWDDVNGTRVDTKSSDPDIQVDCYVDGNDTYLILNNLEPVSKNINLNFFGNRPNLQSVTSKHLYLSGIRDIILDEDNLSSAPATVQLGAEATMILKYTYSNNVSINETSVEKKFFGESVSNDQRVQIQNGDNTFFVNGVTVPQNPSNAEAMLKVTVNLFDAPDDEVGFLSIDKFTFNGVEVETPLDWRGGQQLRSRWFGTLEIPVPANLIQTNNTITLDFHHVGEVCVVNLVTWDFSTAPGRSEEGPTGPDPIAVTGISVSPTSVSLNIGQTATISPNVLPANASNKTVTWTSSNTTVAAVSSTGIVTGNAAGSATITATTADGGFTASSTITVTGGSTGGGDNLALNKPATQSSTYQNNNNFSASEAVDGTTANGNFNHTENDTNAWWEVDLESVSDITTIEVYNRQNCCQGRLSNFHVFVSDVPFTSTNLSSTINQSGVGNYFTAGQGGYPTTLQVNRTGRYVRVQLAGSNFLHMQEVVVNGTAGTGTIAVTSVSVSPANASIQIGQTQQLNETVNPGNATDKSVSWSSSNPSIASVNASGLVTANAEGSVTITATTTDGGFTDTSAISVTGGSTGGGDNIALNKPASQSSTYQNIGSLSASVAVDGTIASGNFNHTENDTNAWWEVDLESVSDITTIEVYNRQNCCQSRLSNFHVFVSNVPFSSTNLSSTINQSGIGNYFTSGTGGSPTTIQVNRTGRYVRVQLAGTNFLHMQELVVNGTEGSSTVPVTSVSVSPTTATLNIGETTDLTETVNPGNATNQSVSWSSSNTLVATVNSNGLVTAVSPGSATITVSTNDGNKTATSAITVNGGGGSATLVIEAENLNATGGTFNDAFAGGPGLGVAISGVGINYVNRDDWAEYSINVAVAGTYSIEYLISTPSNGAQVQFVVDGNIAATTNVPNNGNWDNYTALAGGTATLSTGAHTIRINASGTNDWQWNLDKVTLTTGSGSRVVASLNPDKLLDSSKISLYPNPVQNILRFDGKERIDNVVVYNMLGAKVLSTSLNEDFIDVSALKNGIYTLQISGENLSEVHKIVIRR
ncbi:MAG: Ig-like domain-containing protein [Cyclobacteriaceae bacterium]